MPCSTTHRVRELFALPPRRPTIARATIDADLIRQIIPTLPGQITLITGASGGGKSRLLAHLRRQVAQRVARRVAQRAERPTAQRPTHETKQEPEQETAQGNTLWIDPRDFALPARPVIDCVLDVMQTPRESKLSPRPIEAALELLSRVGLAEAWTYLQTPRTLSDGQRWRLLLAMSLARATRSERSLAYSETPQSKSVATAIIATDEFAALLDRVTAAVVSRTLRRTIDAAANLSAIVVTSHDDLIDALKPDVVVVCDFGSYHVTRRATLNRSHPAAEESKSTRALRRHQHT